MVERTDHFAHLRDAPETNGGDASPVVFPDTVAYLRLQFPSSRSTPPTSLDDAIALATRMAREGGQREVIDHLETLMKAR